MMHPEYPCAHCIAVETILKTEIGNGPTPTLTTTSAAAGGATRSWTNIEDFIAEVANARIYDGVHCRTSTQIGTAMGRRIGELALAVYAQQSAKAS